MADVVILAADGLGVDCVIGLVPTESSCPGRSSLWGPSLSHSLPRGHPPPGLPHQPSRGPQLRGSSEAVGPPPGQ